MIKDLVLTVEPSYNGQTLVSAVLEEEAALAVKSYLTMVATLGHSIANTWLENSRGDMPQHKFVAMQSARADIEHLGFEAVCRIHNWEA